MLKALMVAEQGTRLAGPGVGDGEVALGGAIQRQAFVIHQHRLDAEERTRRGAGLQLDCARQRGDHKAAGFGLPPGVHHRALLVTDLLPVPLPGFRVNRFADRAKNAQRGAVCAFDSFVAFRHQGANSRRGGIENADLMLIDDLAHARRRRPVRHPFEHQGGGAAGQWAVQQIAMAGDPAHVGGAPINIARMVVENVFKGGGRIDQIAAGGVQHPFRFTGGAGGIEDEQRIFGVHFDGPVFGAGVRNQVAPPQIAAFLPVDIAAGAFQDHHVLNAFHVRVFQRVIDVFLQRDGATGAQPFVSGDHQA